MVEQQRQAILFNWDCTKTSIVGSGSSSSTSPYTITFTGGVPGTKYIVGIKYSPKNVIGQAVGDVDESIYTWSTLMPAPTRRGQHRVHRAAEPLPGVVRLRS